MNRWLWVTTYEEIKISVCHTKDLFQLPVIAIGDNLALCLSLKKIKKNQQNLLHSKKKKWKEIIPYEFFLHLRGRPHTQALWVHPALCPAEHFSECFWLEWTYIMLGLCYWWPSQPQEGPGQKLAVAGRAQAIPRGKDTLYPLWKAEKLRSSYPSLRREPKSSRPDCEQPSLLEVVVFLR